MPKSRRRKLNGRPVSYSYPGQMTNTIETRVRAAEKSLNDAMNYAQRLVERGQMDKTGYFVIETMSRICDRAQQLVNALSEMGQS